MNSYYLEAIFIFLIGYFCGCFQTSYFISMKFGKQDIRNIGSGNAGASNITSEMGWKFGIIVAISDILKAYIPVKILMLIFIDTSYQLECMSIAGMGAVLGHIYPFFMNFRGGKGIASYLGMLLAIDWKIGLVAIIMLCLLTIITDYVAIGSILLYVAIPILAFYSGNYSTIVITCTLILLIVGMIKHWINIQRIINGTEKGLRSVL